MNAPYIATSLPRRRFLRGIGVSLGIPVLECMRPVFARAMEPPAPKRMLLISNNLGILPQHFFPKNKGPGYTLSPYLKELAAFLSDFTVCSGLSHPAVAGGHSTENCFLTAAPDPTRSGFRNTISLDQYIAERIGHQTRFPSLTLGVNVQQGVRSLSWTGSGVLIPCEEKPSDVFKRLFVQGTPTEVAAQMRKLAQGQSILDAVGSQAKDLQRSVGARDRDRLDQYFTSVRELEQRMEMSKEWETRPKPHVTAPVPLDPASPKEYMDKVRIMYDMARLAFQTDSTRSISLLLDSVNSPTIDLDHDIKITDGYHNLSHHGRSEAKIAQLKAIDQWHMRLLANLFTDLKAIQEDGESLFDRTMVLYGSNLGNANTHVTTNLPTLFAGGGFRHGQHLGFDTTHNYPLPNLFVSMLQRMGLETDKFATSTGTMRGLEMKG
jgi:BMFP domain-containing protein YqiC